MARAPLPIFRGQGNRPFEKEEAGQNIRRGQEVPYNVNGAPAGGDAATLNGQAGSYYLARANHTGTQLASTISDFTAAVDAIMTAAEILSRLLTVDGAASGLDADLLDGLHASAFALSAHAHAIADVTGLQTALDGKQPLDSDLTTLAANITAFGHSLVDDADAATARGTIGLGSIATQNANAVAITGGSISGLSSLSASGTITSTAGTGTGILDLAGGSGGGGNVGHISFTRTGSGELIRVEAVRSGANDAGAMVFHTKPSGGALTERGRFTPAGDFNVDGLVQCNSFRLDQTPVAETPTPTHTFTVSLNGTTYRIPCLV